jgi:effector-binding domain-containing protein
MDIHPGKVKMFKIKNRKGYAALCNNHLTEGRTSFQAYQRMIKALKRNGMNLAPLETHKIKKLVTGA